MTAPIPSALNSGDPTLNTALETLEKAAQTAEARQALTALKSRMRQNELITQIDQELDAHLDLARVCEILLRWAVDSSSSERGWVLVEGWEGSPPGGEIDCAPTLAELAQMAVFQSGEPILLPLPGVDLYRLAAPLIHHSQVVGAILVERRSPFHPDETAFYRSLGRRAASAVENARLYAAVQAANQAKTKFVSVVTHELRIPMTSIKGYTDLLRKGLAGEVNEMQLSFLDTIRNNVERMSNLVSDLSDISRIETGKITLQSSLMPIEAAVQEAVLTLQPRLDEKRQVLEMHLPEGLPQVFADNHRVVQVMINLLSNASKYTPEAGHIGVQMAVHPQGVRVEVSDTGIGISPEDQHHLFSQFFRSEDPAVREQPGWGLGLHVTKLLVDVMGGSIGVESAVGQGSRFWFVLPTTQTRAA